MRAWWDKYGDDPPSDEAQKALDELREEHRSDMRELFEKYGVTPPAGLRRGRARRLRRRRRRRGCGGRGSDGQGRRRSGLIGGQGMMGGQGWSGSTL